MQNWFFLASAMALEIAGTTSMKLSEGFTRLIPSILNLCVLWFFIPCVYVGPEKDWLECCVRDLGKCRYCFNCHNWNCTLLRTTDTGKGRKHRTDNHWCRMVES